MKTVILFFVIAAAISPAFGAEITLNDAIDMALTNSPGSALAESNYLQGRAGFWEGLGAVTPTVSVSYSGGKNYDRDAFEFNGQVYPITTPDTYWSLQANASYTLLSGISPFNYRGLFAGIASNRSANAGFKEDIAQLYVEVATAFYYVLKTEKLLEVTERSLDASSYNADLAESNLRSGAITRSEYLKTVVQEGNDKIAVIEATAAYEVARDSFFAAVGAPKDDTAVFADVGDVIVEDIPPLDEAFEEALAERPKTAKDYNDYSTAKHSYAQALDSRWPTISATASYTWSDYYAMWDDQVDIDQNDSWFAGISLTWYPLNAFSSESAIRRAKAAKLMAQSNYELSRQSLETEVTNAYYEYKKLSGQVTVAEDTLESATEDFDIVNRMYELGGASAIELTDAQAMYVTAANNYYNALYDYKIAEVEWEKALGKIQKEVKR